jgi:protein-S-isoprenylcysteine O-methyltransferase Ste14
MRKARAAVGSLVFLVLAPGVVAGLVPWWLTRWRVEEPFPYWLPLRVAGVILLAAGVAVLLRAFARFVVEGLGTPAPVAPTERLVIGGLYRHVRNPMYLAVAATIIGQALILGQPILLPYAAAFAVAVTAFVRCYEEPTLHRQFGEQYEAYRRAVPAWWPRREPWEAGSVDRPGRPSAHLHRPRPPPGKSLSRSRQRASGCCSGAADARARGQHTWTYPEVT